MKRLIPIFCLLISAILVVGCLSIESTPNVVTSQTEVLTNTMPTARPTSATPTQAVRAKSTPGENTNILFLSDGGVRVFSLLDGSTKHLDLPSNGDIIQATLSPNENWLVFQDEIGLHILETPFTGQPVRIPANTSDQIHVLFSNDSESLAFSDGEGLKIYDIKEGSTLMLLPHIRNEKDVWKMRLYFPMQWSPDSQWLWIGATHWEGSSRTLVHLPTKRLQEYSACYSSTAWLPTSDAFVATVNYSGYYACGENDGVFFIELADSKVKSERKIYQETTAEKEMREAKYVQVLPNTTSIGFLQLMNPETRSQTSHVILLGLDGRKISEIDLGQEDISEITWSTEGEKVYYKTKNGKRNTMFSLDINTGNKVELVSLSSEIYSIFPLSNSKWLIIVTKEPGKDNWEGLYLVNSVDDAVMNIADLHGDENIAQPFIGIEASP